MLFSKTVETTSPFLSSIGWQKNRTRTLNVTYITVIHNIILSLDHLLIKSVSFLSRILSNTNYNCLLGTWKHFSKSLLFYHFKLITFALTTNLEMKSAYSGCNLSHPRKRTGLSLKTLLIKATSLLSSVLQNLSKYSLLFGCRISLI